MRRALQTHTPRSLTRPTFTSTSTSTSSHHYLLPRRIRSCRHRLQQPYARLHQSRGPVLLLRPSYSQSRSQQQQQQQQHKALYSTNPPQGTPNASKTYDFESINAIISSSSPSRILIDVREPHELQASGTIPTAVNLPLQSAPDALLLSAEDFETRFGFEKPGLDATVIFYCKSGVRSRAAAEIARRAGYGVAEDGKDNAEVAEYPGSWIDWEKNGGRVESVEK